MSFRKAHSLLFILLFIFSFYSYSESYPVGHFCEKSFRRIIKGSKLDYVLQVLEERPESALLHPQFIDIKAERELVREWNEAPDMFRLQNFPLPRDVHYIPRQLYQPGDVSSVKLKDAGDSALIARAYYTYSHSDGKKYRLGTNVVFSARALMDNMESPSADQGLVGKNATAAILFLHGGGTRTTGAHAGASMVNHFRKYKIDVLSLDLPWHAQGHREFFNFESNINVLSAFVKKYIPHNVPLFVWGHSWGGVFAEMLMMMTDRPSFSFHRNLKGVIMMATAVDSAPGKSIMEKNKALNERLRKAKETAKDLGAETEKDIFDNIIIQGKFAPLGNMEASATILQLDQRPPSHEGRSYIAALMLVGTHDSLVYTAWKDLYHKRYENLKNVKAIFVDKATLQVDKKEKTMTRAGHLFADLRYPVLLHGESKPFYGSDKNKSEKEGESILQYGEARAFMEQQLKLGDVRDLIYESVRDSVQANGDVADLKIRIKNLPSFDVAREFLDEGRVRELVPLDRINNIKEEIDRVEKSYPRITADDPSNKPNTNFIHVVQKAATDLAFRFFLKSFRYLDSQISRNKINRSNIEISEDIKKMLHPFTFPLRRVLYFLQGLVTKEDFLLRDFGSITQELKVLISIAHQENSPISHKLLHDLTALEGELKKGVGIQPIVGLAKEILKNNENSFRSIDLSKLPKKPTGLLASVLSPKKGLEAVARELERNRIPKSVIKKVLEKKDELIIYFKIVNGEYIPTEKELELFFRLEEGSKISESSKAQADSEKRRERVMGVFNQLKGVVEEKLGISEDLLYLRRELKDLREARGQEENYRELYEKVARNIKIIQEGLQKARTRPLLSLSKEEAKGKAELREIIEVVDKVEEGLNMQAADMKNLSTEDIIRQFNEDQRANVDNFEKMFSQYVANRQSLDRKIIIALEQGELGKKYQDAVLSIYGSDSRGEPPTVAESPGEKGTGKSTLYLDLVELTRDLAQLEAKLRRLEVQKVELDIEYNHLMHQLLNLLSDVYKKTESGKSGSAHEAAVRETVLNRIRSVIDIFSSEDISMFRLLNGEHIPDITDTLNNGGDNKVDNGSSFIKIKRKYSRKGKQRKRRSLEEDRKVVTEYTDRYDKPLQEVLKYWKRLTATMPPPLPTVMDNVSSGKEVE